MLFAALDFATLASLLPTPHAFLPHLNRAHSLPYKLSLINLACMLTDWLACNFLLHCPEKQSFSHNSKNQDFNHIWATSANVSIYRLISTKRVSLFVYFPVYLYFPSFVQCFFFTFNKEPPIIFRRVVKWGGMASFLGLWFLPVRISG